MKKSTLRLVLATGLTIALGLGACANKADEGAADAASDDAAATETAEVEVAEVGDGAYILTSVKSYLASDNPLVVDEYTIDEEGNIIQEITTVTIDDADPVVRTDTYAYDGEGKLVNIVGEVEGDETEPESYSVTTDDEGKLLTVQRETDEGDGALRTYEYDENGKLSKMIYESNGYTTTREYDEDGYVTGLKSDDYEVSITYTKDENGVPTNALKVIEGADGHEEHEMTFETDDDGNIAKITSKITVSADDEEISDDNNMVFELGYTYVEDASEGAKIHNFASIASLMVQD